jgi:hypothetical protein
MRLDRRRKAQFVTECGISGQVGANRLFKIILTALVPYIVSTVSSASTILSMRGRAVLTGQGIL